MLQIFGEISMPSNNKTASFSINDKFGGKLHIFFGNGLCFDFVPIFDEICLLL
jgi:hypothetical protein